MNLKYTLLAIATIIILFTQGNAQVAINTDGADADPTAMLDVKSQDKGFLIPRLTKEQVEDIVAPANGLLVFCNTDNRFYVFIETNNKWCEVAYGSQEILPGSNKSKSDQEYGKDYTDARVMISADNSEADPSAMVEIKSADRGILVPRLTNAGIVAISNPADGLIAFSTTDNKFYVFQLIENVWKDLAYGPGFIIPGGSTCGGPLVDTRDGKIYTTVQIGVQCWMSQNLNIGSMIYNTAYPTNNGVIEKWCYNVLESNCDIYGGQYYWAEMMEYTTTPGIQGICPDGWHIPSIEEFSVLSDFLGGATTAGGKMKSTGTIEAGTGLWYAPNTGATNSSGFTALPGGQRNVGGSSQFLGNYASFWSSSQNTSITSRAWGCRMYNTMEMLEIGHYTKVPGYSVRCVKNE